eukprot:7719697-Pyramimonas_sp.AAC.1
MLPRFRRVSTGLPIARSDWQPSVPAVVEDGDMFDSPASLPELIEQDGRDEALREVAKPLESTRVRPR